MTSSLVWRQIHWQRPLDEAATLAAVRAWAADQRSPLVILEIRATRDGVIYLLGASLVSILDLQHRLRTAVPEARFTEPTVERLPVQMARRLSLSTRHRALHVDRVEEVSRATLGALTAVQADELLVLQLVLGPRRVPLAVPNNSPSSIVMPWWQIAWTGNGGTVDGEKRAALRAKVSEHGYAATIRLGVRAESAERRKALVIGLASALRLSEAPAIKFRLRRERASKLNRASAPWWWPLRLNAQEVVALAALPIGEAELAGQPPIHPRLLAPLPSVTGTKRVIAEATAPGVDAKLVLPIEAARAHTIALGPPGVGKSTFFSHLYKQDAEAGHAIIVIDPQADLVADALALTPDSRRDDVIVLDPGDRRQQAVVGFNPLLTRGRNPEVVADSVFGVFKGLYGDIGPRSSDLLLNALLSLTRHGDTTLAMLPLLLMNDGFRRSITGSVRDPIVLGPYWQWFEALSVGERTTVTAPLLNKVRPILARTALRNVFGQVTPRLSIADVFRDKRILLVSLAQGQLGPEGAALLGGVLVSSIWQQTTERYGLPPAARTPVTVILDELSAFVRSSDDLSAALARSRGANVGYTLGFQSLSQTPPALRSAVLTNTRSRILFQLSADDAAIMARGQSVLEPDDFTGLGPHEIYYAGFQDGRRLPYASGRTLPPPEKVSDPDELRALSRQRWAQPLDEIERSLLGLIEGESESGRIGRRPRRPA